MVNRGYSSLILSLGLFVILIVATTVTLLNFGNHRPIDNQAVANAPSITMAADVGTLRPGNSSNVKVFLDPVGAQVTMLIVKVKFDQTKLNLDSINIAPGFELIRSTQLERSNNLGAMKLEFVVPPGQNPLSAVSEVATLSFSLDDTVSVKSTTDISVDSAESREFYLPSGYVNPSSTMPLTLTLSPKPVFLKELGLVLSTTGTGEDVRVMAKWDSKYELSGINTYKVVIRRASNGTRVSLDAPNVGIVYKKIFDQTTNLEAGTYYVQLSAIYPTQILMQTKSLTIQTNNLGVISGVNLSN